MRLLRWQCGCVLLPLLLLVFDFARMIYGDTVGNFGSNKFVSTKNYRRSRRNFHLAQTYTQANSAKRLWIGKDYAMKSNINSNYFFIQCALLHTHSKREIVKDGAVCAQSSKNSISSLILQFSQFWTLQTDRHTHNQLINIENPIHKWQNTHQLFRNDFVFVGIVFLVVVVVVVVVNETAQRLKF